MRNLKRALSLALASVMLVGMMVVGTSAASYPDVDEKNNVEAIDVLNAVGVMIGDAGTGNFRPDDKVSRNEMAVIMAKLILGTYEADSYVGSHPFTDVPDWADRYVAACYSSGIIAGRGEGIYDGAATVTAVEAAAMMLRALGYEDLSKGAAQWDQPVAAKANEVNLFDGLSGNSQTPMDRDSVAKLALNTLETTMVTTTRSGSDISIPGVEIISNVNYTLRTSGAGWNGAINNESVPGGGGVYLQLGEQLYKGDLRKTSPTDDFGRPSTKWTYKGEDVVQYADEADATYTEEVKLATIYKDLGLSGNVDFIYYEDSKTATTTDPYDHSTVNSSIAGTEKIGGNGVLVQTYKKFDSNGDLDEVDVCVVNTYVGKVSRVTPAKDAEDRKIAISGAPGTFETEDFAKDDIVLYTKADNVIKTVTLAEKVDDQKVTSFTGAAATASKLVTDKTYKLAAKGSHKDAIAIDSSYDLYLDKYGYVIYSELYEAGESNYAYVLDVGDDGIFGSEKTNYVKLLLTDGTVKDFKSDKDYKTGTNWTGRVVTYTINSDDECELTYKGATQGAMTVTLKANNAVITVTGVGGTNINTNSSTVFVVGTNDGAGGKYTYTVYTGIANVPEIKGVAVSNIAADNGSIAKYVFIQAADSAVSSEADQTIFVKGETKAAKDQLTAADKTVYYEYDAMIEGEATTLKVKTNAGPAGNGALITALQSNVWLKSITENKDGYITDATAYSGTYNPASPSTAGLVGPTTGTNRDGDAVQMGYAAGAWYTLKKDAPVVVVDGDDIVSGSVTDVEESTADSILAVVKDGEIIAMAVARDGKPAHGVGSPLTEGTVMDKVTNEDLADDGRFDNTAQYVVEGLKATVDNTGKITVTGSVPKAKQFTAATAGTINTATAVDGFGTLGGTGYLDGLNSNATAIIPLQAADGHIHLLIVGNHGHGSSNTTAETISFNEGGVYYSLQVVIALTWET